MVHNHGLPPGLPASPLLAFPLTPASTSATDVISTPNLRDCEPQSGQAIRFPAGVLGGSSSCLPHPPHRLLYRHYSYPPNSRAQKPFERSSLSSSSSRSALSRSLSSCSRRVLSAFSVSSSRVRSSAFSAARVSSLAVSSRTHCPNSAPTSSASAVLRRLRGSLLPDCRLSRRASRLDTETKYRLSLPSPSSLASSSPSCIRLRHCRGLMPKAAAATLVVTHPWVPESLPRVCPILQAA
jgi:hypothetical protein